MDGDMALCLEQASDIDAQSRAALLNELDAANTEADRKTEESLLWRACYEEATGMTTHAAERERTERLRLELQARDLELQRILRLKEDLERELSACQAQLADTSRALARLEEEDRRLRAQLADAAADKDGLQVQLSHKAHELEEARKTIKALTTLAESRKQQHGQDLRTLDHLRHELDTVRSELQEACERLRVAGLGALCDDDGPRS